jgi:hypothetical protein
MGFGIRTEQGGFDYVNSEKVLFMLDCKTYLEDSFWSRRVPEFLKIFIAVNVLCIFM